MAFKLTLARPGLLDWLLKACLAAAALAAALTGFAAAAVPRLDALNHAAPFAFVGAVGVSGLALLRWRRRLLHHAGVLGAAAFAVTMFGASVIPEAAAGLAMPSAAAPTARAAPTVRVVQLNTWQGGRTEAALVAYLVNSEADFLVLQETGSLYRPGLAPLRAAYPFVVESISAPYAQVAILSRHAPTSLNALAGAAWDAPADQVQPRRLRWVEAAFDVQGKPVHLVGLHVRRNTGARGSAAQLASVARALAPAPEPQALIVVGDFNLTPWTHTLRRFGVGLGLRRSTRNLATYPTPARGNPHWPPFAVFPIDHQFSGSRWRAIAARRGPDVGSDHFPVEVTYRWVAAP